MMASLRRARRSSSRDRKSCPSASWYTVLILGCLVVLCILFKLLHADGHTSIRSQTTPTSKTQAERNARDTMIRNESDGVLAAISSTRQGHTHARAPTYTREQETCDSMSLLYGRPFVKVRPAFLVNPETKRRLEIDCYNDELKIGAEFNGIGHYKWPNPFHRTEAEFHAQLRRDRYKQNICKQMGVKLFIVPDSVRKGHILEYLRKLQVSAQSQ